MSIQKPFQTLLTSVPLAPLWFAIAAAEEAPLKLTLVVHVILILNLTGSCPATFSH
jgi:hypothetical protein